MARLRNTDDSTLWLVPAHCVIGRSSACQLRLSSAQVSGEHALLRWRNGLWELQDLHSRNGTYVDGSVLAAGQRVVLPAGATLGFGSRAGFELVESGPPVPHATSVEEPSRVIEVADGFLSLPSADDPELMVLHRDRQWWIETAEGLEATTDGRVVSASGGLWRLHLPEPLMPTCDATDAALTLDSLTFEFHVDHSEGAVALLARCGDQRIDLETRAHHATLLALAQVRLEDRRRASHQRGWIQQDALIERLGYDARRLHVEIHRSRRQLAGAGILDAVHVVERRRTTRELRIGVAQLEIHEGSGSSPTAC